MYTTTKILSTLALKGNKWSNFSLVFLTLASDASLNFADVLATRNCTRPDTFLRHYSPSNCLIWKMVSSQAHVNDTFVSVCQPMGIFVCTARSSQNSRNLCSKRVFTELWIFSNAGKDNSPKCQPGTTLEQIKVYMALIHDYVLFSERNTYGEANGDIRQRWNRREGKWSRSGSLLKENIHLFFHFSWALYLFYKQYPCSHELST